MTIYQKLLQYYLDSEHYFQHFVLQFYTSYNHIGQCGEKQYDFESALYRRCEERVKKNSGFCISLSDLQIQRYFSDTYSENQRFAIIYALWFGLNDIQVRNLQRHKKATWELLQYYLCNPDRTDVLLFNPNAYANNYKGSYYIHSEQSDIKAFYHEGSLISEDTDEQFEIL